MIIKRTEKHLASFNRFHDRNFIAFAAAENSLMCLFSLSLRLGICQIWPLMGSAANATINIIYHGQSWIELTTILFQAD